MKIEFLEKTHKLFEVSDDKHILVPVVQLYPELSNLGMEKVNSGTRPNVDRVLVSQV